MPNYCIFRVEKVKGGGAGRASINGLQKEHCRTADEKEAMKGRNPDIKWEKTDYNYNLCRTDGTPYDGDTGRNWNQVIDERLKEMGIKPRKDAVRLLDSVYTASPDWFIDKTQDEVDEYFSACVDFHEKYYGEVISARVHYDEATPHIQIASIPLTREGKLSAKQLIGNRRDLSGRQTDFFNEVGKRFGMDRGIINEPGTARKHQRLAEYKANQEIKRYKELRSDIHKLAVNVAEFARKAPSRLAKMASGGMKARRAEKEWNAEARKIADDAARLDARIESNDDDDNWNLMSEFEKDEMAHEQFVKDLI